MGLVFTGSGTEPHVLPDVTLRRFFLPFIPSAYSVSHRKRCSPPAFPNCTLNQADRGLLPEILHIPGSDRTSFPRSSRMGRYRPCQQISAEKPLRGPILIMTRGGAQVLCSRLREAVNDRLHPGKHYYCGTFESHFPHCRFSALRPLRQETIFRLFCSLWTVSHHIAGRKRFVPGKTQGLAAFSSIRPPSGVWPGFSFICCIPIIFFLSVLIEALPPVLQDIRLSRPTGDYNLPHLPSTSRSPSCKMSKPGQQRDLHLGTTSVVARLRHTPGHWQRIRAVTVTSKIPQHEKLFFHLAGNVSTRQYLHHAACLLPHCLDYFYLLQTVKQHSDASLAAIPCIFLYEGLPVIVFAPGRQAEKSMVAFSNLTSPLRGESAAADANLLSWNTGILEPIIRQLKLFLFFIFFFFLSSFYGKKDTGLCPHTGVLPEVLPAQRSCTSAGSGVIRVCPKPWRSLAVAPNRHFSRSAALPQERMGRPAK